MGLDGDSNGTILNTYFFNDVEGIHRFAAMSTHMDAWKMYNANPHKTHIGIFHETYVVPAGGYESLYNNCRPVLMGQGLVKRDTKEGEKWVSTLVDANTPRLKSYYARLGRDHHGNVQA
jgi:hypothetical protein